MLGCDPDEGSKRRIKGLVGDGQHLGRDAVAEIAADHASHSIAMTGRHLAEIARTAGIEADRASALQLREIFPASDADGATPVFSRGFHKRAVALGLHAPGRPFLAAEMGHHDTEADDGIKAEDAIAPARQQGAILAAAVRQHARVAVHALDDHKLCEIAGVPRSAVDDAPAATDLGFALDDTELSSRVVLRSRSARGRRFEVARLLGDRLVAPSRERLFPATRTFTYRQKRQRAFAAELLCPAEALIDVLGKSPTPDDIEDAARHFQVPGHVVAAQLLQGGWLSADELEDDFDATL